MTMEGMPSGPGAVEDLILWMARFMIAISTSGRGCIVKLAWLLGGRLEGVARGGSKDELKKSAKSCADSAGEDAWDGPNEQRGGVELSVRIELITLQNWLLSLLMEASISAKKFLRRNFPRKLHSLRS